MDRGEDRDAYEERGIVDLPDDGMLWYTDGGLVQSEPIGRVVAAAREHGEDAQAAHVNLAIDARSEAPDDASRWGDADGGGGWIEGLSRALAIFPAQALYDDMRRVQRDNDRIGEVDRLVDSLREDLGDERAERVGEQIADLAGVAGKRVVDVDLISPLVMAEETGEDVSELLAGEHMGDFSGFLEEELRRSDFSLGYECGIAWARACLDRFDLDRGVVERSIEAMEEARLYDWDEVRRGDVEPKDLSVRARLRLARMATRAVRALRSSG
jgi:hypothetical protein